MKKFWKTLMVATLGVFALSSCEDVPAPYDIPGANNGGNGTTSTFYSSTNCSDWSMVAAASGNNPWSQGSSYTQATGYQKWDGAESKTNRMADGYLISPAFSTTTDSTTAYISFQYCVGYANNDAQFADHIKLYVSSQYDSAEGFVAEKWTQLDWKATHTSTNWELETTTVTLPAEFLNKESVNVAFYFTTPDATKSSTFEVKDVKIVAGTPTANSGETPDLPTGLTGDGTLEKPYTVADALAIINAKSNTSDKVYIKGKISAIGIEKNGALTDLPGNSYGNATYFISDDGTTATQLEVFRGYGLGGKKFTSADDIKVGDDVIILGVLKLYNTTPEVDSGSSIVELNGQKAEDNGGDDNGGNDNNQGSTEGISVEGTTVTLTNSALTPGSTTTELDLNTLEYANAQDLDGVSATMSDGTVVTFSIGSGSTTPKFYTATKGVRMYANNSISFASTSKAIAKVVLECDAYNGTDYVGNDTKTATFENKTVTLFNTYGSNSGGVQLRVKTIAITYAD